MGIDFSAYYETSHIGLDPEHAEVIPLGASPTRELRDVLHPFMKQEGESCWGQFDLDGNVYQALLAYGKKVGEQRDQANAYLHDENGQRTDLDSSDWTHKYDEYMACVEICDYLRRILRTAQIANKHPGSRVFINWG